MCAARGPSTAPRPSPCSSRGPAAAATESGGGHRPASLAQLARSRPPPSADHGGRRRRRRRGGSQGSSEGGGGGEGAEGGDGCCEAGRFHNRRRRSDDDDAAAPCAAGSPRRRRRRCCSWRRPPHGRLRDVQTPPYVVFDEKHFARSLSRRAGDVAPTPLRPVPTARRTQFTALHPATFFFDVHPPLAKLALAGADAWAQSRASGDRPPPARACSRGGRLLERGVHVRSSECLRGAQRDVLRVDARLGGRTRLRRRRARVRHHDRRFRWRSAARDALPQAAMQTAARPRRAGGFAGCAVLAGEPRSTTHSRRSRSSSSSTTLLLGILIATWSCMRTLRLRHQPFTLPWWLSWSGVGLRLGIASAPSSSASSRSRSSSCTLPPTCGGFWAIGPSDENVCAAPANFACSRQWLTPCTHALAAPGLLPHCRPIGDGGAAALLLYGAIFTAHLAADESGPGVASCPRLRATRMGDPLRAAPAAARARPRRRSRVAAGGRRGCHRERAPTRLRVLPALARAPVSGQMRDWPHQQREAAGTCARAAH